MPTRNVTVGSAVGLHARPAAIIAEKAAELSGSVTIGMNSAKGNLVMGASYFKRDIIYARDSLFNSPGASFYSNNLIILRDAKGRPIMTFVEDETGLPSSPDLQAPKYYLVPRIAGYTHLPQPSELVGQWTLRSRGRPPCLLTLTATPAISSAPRRGIALGKGCAGKPLPARLTRWSIEGTKIMLWGAGDDLLALEPVGDDRYVAEPGAWVLSR